MCVCVFSRIPNSSILHCIWGQLAYQAHIRPRIQRNAENALSIFCNALYPLSLPLTVARTLALITVSVDICTRQNAHGYTRTYALANSSQHTMHFVCVVFACCALHIHLFRTRRTCGVCLRVHCKLCTPLIKNKKRRNVLTVRRGQTTSTHCNCCALEHVRLLAHRDHFNQSSCTQHRKLEPVIGALS